MSGKKYKSALSLLGLSTLLKCRLSSFKILSVSRLGFSRNKSFAVNISGKFSKRSSVAGTIGLSSFFLNRSNSPIVRGCDNCSQHVNLCINMLHLKNTSVEEVSHKHFVLLYRNTKCKTEASASN